MTGLMTKGREIPGVQMICVNQKARWMRRNHPLRGLEHDRGRPRMRRPKWHQPLTTNPIRSGSDMASIAAWPPWLDLCLQYVARQDSLWEYSRNMLYRILFTRQLALHNTVELSGINSNEARETMCSFYSLQRHNVAIGYLDNSYLSRVGTRRSLNGFKDDNHTLCLLSIFAISRHAASSILLWIRREQSPN